LTEAMDTEGLKQVLRKILGGDIRCIAVDTPIPSEFSHEILNANPFAYLDDAPLEERRARAVEMRRMLPETVVSEVGKLDADAIAEVCEEAWPDVRDADELHDVLQTLVALPEVNSSGEQQDAPLKTSVRKSVSSWQKFFEELTAEGRAARASASDRRYWVAAERAKSFAQLFPEAQLATPLGELEQQPTTREDALRALVTGWIEHSGPVTARSLSDVLGLPPAEIESTLLRIEAGGAVLRGKFTDTAGPNTEWCERRLLGEFTGLPLEGFAKRFSRWRRPNSCAGFSAGSTSRRGHNFSANTGHSKCCGNCRVTKLQPIRGSIKSWRGASSVTTRKSWISCA
jgi:ATP-dependent helicase Lhr and Lhr-like helicase